MRTGFIGLGAMGASMARNLHRAGFLAAVWNRTAAKAQALATELGCEAASSPAAIAARCEALVLCVSADDDVRAVVAAIAPHLAAGSLVIDCSTVSAATAQAASTQLAARGVDFLDAPVSGGMEGAKKGTLAIMVGGNAAALERARPLLAAMGQTITHFGPAGAGQAAKATNQIMVAAVIRGCAEALAFARASGLDLDKVIDTLGKGAGGSWYLTARGPFMARRNFPAGFRVTLHQKDLRICREMARELGASLPVVDDLLAEYEKLIADGHGEEDISSLYLLKEALFKAPAKARDG